MDIALVGLHGGSRQDGADGTRPTEASRWPKWPPTSAARLSVLDGPSRSSALLGWLPLRPPKPCCSSRHAAGRCSYTLIRQVSVGSKGAARVCGGRAGGRARSATRTPRTL
eukprot:362291-Chlamydomonas_euryale.AAC.3